MNREPNVDELKALALKHPVVAEYGIPTPEHAGEYVIRLYEDRDRAVLAADLGWVLADDDTIIIRGMSGILIAHPARMEFVPNPSLTTMAGSLASTATRSILDIFSGHGLTASNDIIKARRLTCGACVYVAFDPTDAERAFPSCQKCGCATSRKTLLRASECPEGFWAVEA
jgi:hypothetical protein